MRQRLLLGPLMIAILVALLWADETLAGRIIGDGRVIPRGIVILPVVVVLAAMGARELTIILRAKGVMAEEGVLVLSACAGVFAAAFPVLQQGMFTRPTDALALAMTSGTLVLFGSLWRASRGKNTKGVLAAAGGSVFAFAYLGLMFGFLFLIRERASAWVVLWVLLVTKSCDIGAYFTGKAIGRRKLIVWLSPGKTWEGLFGGVALASVVGGAGLYVLRRYVDATLPPVWTGMAAGAVFAPVGQVGDLLASLLKRDAGLKDSGSVLPGFGGILDVIDSPLLVLPVAYWWVVAAGIGR